MENGRASGVRLRNGSKIRAREASQFCFGPPVRSLGACRGEAVVCGTDIGVAKGLVKAEAGPCPDVSWRFVASFPVWKGSRARVFLRGRTKILWHSVARCCTRGARSNGQVSNHSSPSSMSTWLSGDRQGLGRM